MTDTTTTSGPVLVFPGQGGFDGMALQQAGHRYPQIRAVFEEIDRVTTEQYGRRVSEVLLDGRPAELPQLLKDAPWVSQLAIYGAGLAAHRILTDRGVRPGALVGHSLGEITALVAAGAYSVEDGALIVLRRTAAIAGLGTRGGSMVALAASPDRAAHLVALVGDPLLAVATENHDTQTVLSGPGDAIEHVRAIAARLGIGCTALDAAFAFHNPALAEAAPAFAEAIEGLTQHAPRVLVHSPILRRAYEPTDDLAQRLADHFTLPVGFSTAIRELYGRGHRTFVETGGRAILSSLVPKALRGIAGDDLTVLSTLSVGRGDVLRLPATLTALRDAGLTAGDDELDAVHRRLVPALSPGEFAAFWASAGGRITGLAEELAQAFHDGTPQPDVTDPAPVADPRPAAVPGRDELLVAVRELYAQALEYPEEVFTPDALLEAELGVDSVKQVELLSRASQQFGLPPRSSDFRLADYGTLGRIVELLHDELTRHRLEGSLA
ncbi:acyltransferase domain-containing protein [Streptomyces xanthochromogenes]|uniref:acyltransferase domain-containing protein n=1 Tax=Streptomyces xanthochromogenes TaxID=67384 RepID=UPI0034224697